MKLFYVMIVLVLLALALPFFMKGPSGQPIVTLDKVVGDTEGNIAPGEPVEMYRWQDEHGVWQFGEEAPEQVSAAKLTVDDSRTTAMGSEWNLAAPVTQATAADSVNFKAPNTLNDAYRAAPELMDATRRAVDKLNNRQQGMDEFVNELNQKYNN